MRSGRQLITEADVLINVLNVYRFLLILDSRSHRIGVWQPESRKNMEEHYFGRLRISLDQQVQRFTKQADDPVSHAASLREFARHSVATLPAIEELKERDLVASSHRNLSTLFLIGDLLSRIDELVSSLPSPAS